MVLPLKGPISLFISIYINRYLVITGDHKDYLKKNYWEKVELFTVRVENIFQLSENYVPNYVRLK